jgi:hypothetical protein
MEEKDKCIGSDGLASVELLHYMGCKRRKCQRGEYEACCCFFLFSSIGWSIQESRMGSRYLLETNCIGKNRLAYLYPMADWK